MDGISLKDTSSETIKHLSILVISVVRGEPSRDDKVELSIVMVNFVRNHDHDGFNQHHVSFSRRLSNRLTVIQLSSSVRNHVKLTIDD